MTSKEQWFEGVMYTAYGDDSADETKHRVFAVAGLFGSKTDWNQLRIKWRARTKGKIFHATECDADLGAYEYTGHKENKQLYADLTNIIAKSNLLGWAVSLSLLDFKELLVPHLDENPYYICFHSVVIALAKNGSFCIPRRRIKFIFDRNQEIAYNAGALYDHIVRQSTKEWSFGDLMDDELGFATRKTVGIQAADLLAREAMKLLDNRIGPVSRNTRKSTQVLLATKRIKIRQYDRKWCEDMLRNSQNHQYLRTEYLTWLEDQRLNHTLANRLRYEMQRGS